MPDILKQQGVFPAKDSVRIPDIVFKRQEEITDLPIESAEEDGSEEPVFEEENTRLSYVIEPQEISKEEIAEKYQEELAEVYQEAREKGYNDALRQKRSELVDYIEKVDQTLAQMQEMQRLFMQKSAQEMKYLAVDIAEKMILTKIAEDDMVLSHLVMHMVENVKNASWLNVEVSERLVSLVEFLKAELAKPEYHGKAGLTPTVCGNDTCRVSTEEGTTVATVSVQAQNLREIFQVAEAE